MRSRIEKDIKPALGKMKVEDVRPADIDAMLQRYRAVTPEDALAAYRDVIDPDALSLAVVGSAAELSGRLTDAGFAPVIQSADAPVV